MGYQTSYALCLKEGDEQRYEQFLGRLAEVAGDNEIKDEFFTAKWYDAEADLAKVSAEYPDLLVDVEAEGEGGADDVWRMRCRAGKVQTCDGHVVYDPYDDEFLSEKERAEKALKTAEEYKPAPVPEKPASELLKQVRGSLRDSILAIIAKRGILQPDGSMRLPVHRPDGDNVGVMAPEGSDMGEHLFADVDTALESDGALIVETADGRFDWDELYTDDLEALLKHLSGMNDEDYQEAREYAGEDE